MVPTSFRILLAVVFAICLRTSQGNEPDAAPPQSNAVELEGHVYRLILHDNALALSRRKQGADSATNRQLGFPNKPEMKIGALRLEPWLDTNLCAIVEVQTRDGYEYHGLTMSAPERSEGYDSASAIFFRSKERHRILALNGTYEGDTMIAVLAVVRRTKQGMAAERGVLVFDTCPYPPTEGNQSVSKVQATTQFPAWPEPK
jgi:hypothetical protein